MSGFKFWLTVGVVGVGAYILGARAGRALGADELERLVPARVHSLEQALEFCRADECLEVTPAAVRMRKTTLVAHERAKERNRAKKDA